MMAITSGTEKRHEQKIKETDIGPVYAAGME
jgi:hypothetical protein